MAAPELGAQGDQSQFQINLGLIRARPDAYLRVRQAAEAFAQLTDPTPGDYSDYWAERWEGYGTLLDTDVTVSRCDRSRDEIQELRGQGRTLVVRPDGITLVRLGLIHPDLQSWTTQSDSGVESDPRFGWLDVEDSTRAPNLGTNVDDLKEIARKTGKHGMTEETYIIGSEDHFDRTGKYFDHGYQTWSRLLGSRGEGHVVGAGFHAGGRLRADSHWHPGYRSGDVGGRLEGVKAA